MTPKEFVANFETVAEAPGGIKKLREMVLDLAVRGNLSSKSAPKHHDPSAGPFAIPSHWEWLTGSSAFDFVTSGSRGWAQYYATTGPIFLRIGNLDYGTTRLDLSSVQRVAPPPNAEGTRTRVQPGDILISITGDTGMVGLVPFDLGEAYINQHIALARPTSSIFSEYMALALTAPFSLGRLQAAQRGIKNSLGLDDIRNLRVPLPPLAEQKRIVAKVDQLMALCDDLEARQAKKRETAVRLNRAALDALTTAEGPKEVSASLQRVLENFEALVDKPESVQALRTALLRLAMQGNLVKQSGSLTFGVNGSSPDTKVGDFVDFLNGYAFKSEWFAASGVRLLRNVNVSHGDMRWNDVVHVSPERAEEFKRFELVEGDIVVSLDRPIISTGVKVARVSRADLPCLLLQRVAKVVLKENAVDAEFFLAWLSSPMFTEAIDPGRSKGVPHISTREIGQIPIVLPTLSEQRSTMKHLRRLTVLCDSLEAALRRAETTAQKLAEAVVAEIVA